MTNNSEKIVDHLNIILRNELVAINQYYLHAKILQDQGFNKLASFTKAESIDEMKHADIIIERILFLKGMPKMTEYKDLSIGKTPESMMKKDLELEVRAIADLRNAIKAADENQDTGTKTMLEEILVSEEKHFEFLETQLDLIKNLGIENYLTTQI